MKEGTQIQAFLEKVLWEGDIHWVLRGIREVNSN